MRLRATLIAVLTMCIFGAAPLAAQSVSGGVTRWPSIAKASWPAGAVRRALIVGNGTYRPAGATDDEPPVPLHNLASACDDAELVAKSLSRAGWRPEEIAVACDQPSDDVTDGLRHLLSILPTQSLPGQVTVIYLSGHGVQIGGRSYFFGTNAKPNFGAAADAILDSDGRELFGLDASNLLAQIGLLGRYAPSAVLMVVDACRDDPVFDQAKLRLVERYRDRLRLPEQEITRLTQGAISAPSMAGHSPPEGVKVLFASDSGATVDDGGGPSGHGRLAAALADHLVRDQSLNEAVSGAALDVIKATSGLPAEKAQTPQSFGNLKGNPCVTDCATHPRVASTAALPRGPARIAGARFVRASLFQVSGGGQGPGQPVTTARSATILDRPVRGRLARTVEIFWCAMGAPEDVGRSDQATQLGRLVAARIADPALAGVGVVRVTRLEPEKNALAANRSNGNVIRFESADAGLAQTLSAGMPGLALERRRIGIEGYVPVYFCNGTYSGPQPATLYIQVPNRDLLNTASGLLVDLTGSLPDIDVVPHAEVLPEKSPDRSQVRYYDAARRSVAERLATVVGGRLGVRVRAVLFSRLATPGRMTLFELWLGRKDAGTILSRSQSPRQTTRQSRQRS